jgi:hypothetical protein
MKLLNRLVAWLFKPTAHQEKGLLDPQTQKDYGDE